MNAWPPDEAPHFERSRGAVTERLDRELLEQAWSAGEHMSFARPCGTPSPLATHPTNENGQLTG